MDRRHFMGLAGVGTAVGVGALVAAKLRRLPRYGGANMDVIPNRIDSNGNTETMVEIALTAAVGDVPLQPGARTRVWRYSGTLQRGNPARFQAMEQTYLGPIIRVRRGQRLRVHFTNHLPEPTVIHWHGLRVPETMDGHPRYIVAPGQTYVYEFDVKNRAGTYWYHAHPADRTGPQVYLGLAGLLLVSDDEEENAGLPTGEFDVPLVLQDRTFDSDNQLVYLQGGMMDHMVGFLGDNILVNGHRDFELPVASAAYRLRFLNGSNSRIYKLAWSDGTPLRVIGTDGGLLESSVQRDYVILAPAERIELWADFSHLEVGAKRTLHSLEFSLPTMGMMQNDATLPNGASFPVLTVHVTKRDERKSVLPPRLSHLAKLLPQDSINNNSPRTIALTMAQMNWLLNGHKFELVGVAENERVRLNTQESWLLTNDETAGDGGGMMSGMKMPHPIHIHGVQFQIADRQVSPEHRADWETIGRGHVDEGWKDTVLVMPGERVKLLIRFEEYAGLFLYHCHNLEHEDMGMMRNYLIQS